MNIARNKALAIAIATFLVLSMTASMVLIPKVSAHTPGWNIPTYAYIFAAPNPIGVGQTTHVYMWLDPVFGAAGFATVGYSYALLSNDYRFHNYQLTITSPSGTNTTESWAVVTDPTSSQPYAFTPTTAGTWTLTFSFAGQAYAAYAGEYNPTSSLVGDTYLPSTTSTTVTVQSTPIPSTPAAALPTNYWQYPIYGQNYDWYTISSNWLGFGTGLSGSIPGPSGYTSTILYKGDAVGPLTSHIMWTTPTQFGGEVGGNMYPNDKSIGYFEGSSYAPRFQNPIIIDGYLYYTVVASFTGSPLLGGSATGPTVCVNLQTGQQLWSNKNIPQLSFGYTMEVYDPDQHGVFPAILVAEVGSTWELFDGFTGDSLFNVTNVPSGAVQWGPSGEYLQYIFNNVGTFAAPDWYLEEWNSSRLWLYDINPYTGTGSVSPSVLIQPGNGFLFNFISSQIPIPITGEDAMYPNGTVLPVPYGSTLNVDGNIGIAEGRAISAFNSPTTYDWNVSLPWLNPLPVPPVVFTPFGPVGGNDLTVGAVDYGDMMLCYTALPEGFPASDQPNAQLPWTVYAINLNSSVGAIGSLLWSKTYTPPPGNLTVTFSGADWQTRTFVMNYEETMQWVGYSLTNGQQLWGPTTSENALSYYGTPGSPPNQAFLAYGNLYSSSYGGVCYAWNDKTGQPLFTWGNGGPSQPDNSTYSGFNGPYGVYPTQIQSIANGVVYLATDEHTVTNPIYVGATLAAINATTGQQIWRLSGYPSEWAGTGSAWAMAAGYLTFFNGYDGQIYSVGKGPSATTVTVGPKVTTFGDNVVISGTVIDTSAGTQQAAQKADFPNGVPCAADSIMTQWMGYVYQQQAQPTTFTGVPVTITVKDSNNNCYVIGTATTDISGTYSLTWVPSIPGNFTVYASFGGTNAYWPSSGETTFNVMSAPPTMAPTASPPSGLASTGTVELGVVAIIIVIIIIGAILAVLTVRKRP
ncbi:MAG TPA: hypothetical protein VK536_00990 [Candidatus Limnocylindrales bacterium]|nr:hypothetical protein [Candidatus Limnocylindrales bacterium]